MRSILWEFQSTLPRGERLVNYRVYQDSETISIHAPARGATIFGKYICHMPGNFNPRSREGSDYKKVSGELHAVIFQSTLPRGERRKDHAGQPVWSGHFNPRSREGSDGVPSFALIPLNFISIHAPARGATILLCNIQLFSDISIHAPARGATSDKESKTGWITISIHAPARGATITKLMDQILQFIFQSTLPRGERQLMENGMILFILFQSTLPRGERRKIFHTLRRLCCNFNPRSREGSDSLTFRFNICIN